MPKNVYLAGRTDKDDPLIGEFGADLEIRGHTVIKKWWQIPRLPRPSLDFSDTSSTAAEAMINAAYDCEVYILFPRPATIVEPDADLGSALASIKHNPDKQVIVVNHPEAGESVFYAHPAIIAVSGIAQITLMPWY